MASKEQATANAMQVYDGIKAVVQGCEAAIEDGSWDETLALLLFSTLDERGGVVEAIVHYAEVLRLGVIRVRDERGLTL